MTDAADSIAFIGELTLPDGRRLAETMPADPWIEDDVLRPILERRDDGTPAHKVCWIETARGHYKTGIVACIALADALSMDATTVIAVAADKDQAGLLTEAIAGQFRRNPRLASMFKITQDVLTVKATGSRIRIMSSDAPSAYGIGVDARRLRIICDEIGQWARRDLFDAMMTALPKVADAQMVVITNAGIRGSWQEEARAAIEGVPGNYLYAPAGVIASWISAADLAQVEASLPAPVFRRYYDNVWSNEVSGFVPMEWWDACRAELPDLAAGEPVVLGVDAAYASDTFSIVTCSDMPGRPDVVAVRHVAIWVPPAHGTIDFEDPYAFLGEMVRGFNIVQIAYDPAMLHDFTDRFRKEFTVWVSEFPQGRPRAIADSDLLARIRDRRLAHNGDPQLREHVKNAALEISRREDTCRIVKAGKGKIDAVIALSMAASRVSELTLEAAAR